MSGNGVFRQFPIPETQPEASVVSVKIRTCKAIDNEEIVTKQIVAFFSFSLRQNHCRFEKDFRKVSKNFEKKEKSKFDLFVFFVNSLL